MIKLFHARSFVPRNTYRNSDARLLFTASILSLSIFYRVISNFLVHGPTIAITSLRCSIDNYFKIFVGNFLTVWLSRINSAMNTLKRTNI